MRTGGETVKVLAVEDIARRRERDEDVAEQRHLKIMIEAMVRRGCSEREIVAAVDEATGQRSAA